MEESEDRSPQARSEGKKLPWERPTVTLAGTISLLVRSGSAMGKRVGNFDGDMHSFQCDPMTDSNCQPPS
jgi:hypothetical protein